MTITYWQGCTSLTARETATKAAISRRLVAVKAAAAAAPVSVLVTGRGRRARPPGRVVVCAAGVRVFVPAGPPFPVTKAAAAATLFASS